MYTKAAPMDVPFTLALEHPNCFATAEMEICDEHAIPIRFVVSSMAFSWAS
jgi:hypothetical protein